MLSGHGKKTEDFLNPADMPSVEEADYENSGVELSFTQAKGIVCSWKCIDKVLGMNEVHPDYFQPLVAVRLSLPTCPFSIV